MGKGKLSFLKLAENVIREENKPLSADEIWAIAEEKGYAALTGTTGKTPKATLAALLYVDTKDNPNSLFQRIGTRPVKFGLHKTPPGPEPDERATTAKTGLGKAKKTDYDEADLVPFLTYFAYARLKAYTKTIRHETSKKGKQGETEWLHPDVVGCYLPIGEWDEAVIEISEKNNQPIIKFFSFELKKAVDFGNLREAFFQAVSNSSWANEGYLVAAEISDDPVFRDELKRLTNSFGIGVIKLDINDADNSHILLPANTKPNIDVLTVNVLAEKNKGFKEFLKRVSIDAGSKEIRGEWYNDIKKASEIFKEFKKTREKKRN